MIRLCRCTFIFSAYNKDVRPTSGCRFSYPGYSVLLVYITDCNYTNMHFCYKSENITKTRLYSFDPLKPHFYIVKLGFTGVYIIFLIFAQNIDCGYSLELPQISENFHFFSGKIFSIFE